jgi:membrane fusion protein (multidrug efflux system)
MRRAFFFILVLLLLAGLAGGLGYFQFLVKPAMIRGFIANAPQPVQAVAVVEAKSENWVPRIPSIGTFRAVAGIDVAPEVSGVVTAIHFESGQDVNKGDPLVNIDDSVEQADLAANIATLKNAEFALQRQLELAKTQSTARSSVDQAQATRDAAAAAVNRSRALIAQKSLVAPFSGRVGLRKIDAGQYVSPGTSIATLQQLDPIFVDFPIPEQSFGALRLGQPVEVKVDAYPGRTFTGTVSSIDARIDPNTRNVLVRAQLPNKERLLRPGMFANVDVLSGAAQKVVTLPATAITFSLYGDSVFVVKSAPAAPGAPDEAHAAEAAANAPKTAERRFVRTGATRGDRVAVTEGVTVGEKVISEGQIKLQPNARVRIAEDGALPPPPTPRPKE